MHTSGENLSALSGSPSSHVETASNFLLVKLSVRRFDQQNVGGLDSGTQTSTGMAHTNLGAL